LGDRWDQRGDDRTDCCRGWRDEPLDITAFGSRALFEGYDTNHHYQVWVTDGTAAGTSELNIAGTYSIGPFFDISADFTVLGSKVLFAGYDTSRLSNLWVTDGTATGTSELEVSSAGLSPSDITVFGSKALFDGESGNLWVTDGTAAGTSELKASLGPSDITVFGSKALFDSGGNLWVTDGTAAGTSELIVAGAANPMFSGFTSDFTVLGNKAVFKGEDSGRITNLWVTDGTAAGSSELRVVGANSRGLFSLVQHDPDFTVLGTKALFNGMDANGSFNLWVTDGTPAGTSQLTVTGVAANGVNPQAITVLGNKASFEGPDPHSGGFRLWVTDGTSAGTSELTVPGESGGGLFDGVLPQFIVLGNKALFAGRDANNRSLGDRRDRRWNNGDRRCRAYSPRLFANGVAPDFTLLPPSLDLPWQTDGTSIFFRTAAAKSQSGR
jgi:ELWxxDGT repeat protein